MNPALAVSLALLALAGGGPKKPSLTLTGPHFVSVSDYTGRYAKGVLTLTARINGPITEQWYCPKVVWVWPDGSRSTYEQDCAPWSPEAAKEAPYRWSKTVAIPEGYWTFAVELYKGEKRLATAYWNVRVGSSQEMQ